MGVEFFFVFFLVRTIHEGVFGSLKSTRTESETTSNGSGLAFKSMLSSFVLFFIVIALLFNQVKSWVCFLYLC